MPARVDPEQRRRHVVDAAFRLVVAGGIGEVSLRKVAVEADLNIGSVRHFFDGHEDLLAAAATEAGERMGRRLARRPPDQLRGLSGEQRVEALASVIEQVLPIDGERREEAIVVLELVLAARTRPVFAPVVERMARDLHEMMVGALAAAGARDAEAAAGQLTALIGGLTIDAVTPHGKLAPEQIRSTLRTHLRLLLDQGTTG